MLHIPPVKGLSEAIVNGERRSIEAEGVFEIPLKPAKLKFKPNLEKSR
jgi:hypothetical protein